jgi:hypothetical protein
MLAASDGKLIECSEVAPATTHATDGFGIDCGTASGGEAFHGLCRRQVLLRDRPRFQLAGEVQQHLIHFTTTGQIVGARAVVPLLDPQQFHFQTQPGDFQLVDAFLKLTRLFFALLHRGVPLARDCCDDRFEQGRIVRQRVFSGRRCIGHDDKRYAPAVIADSATFTFFFYSV